MGCYAPSRISHMVLNMDPALVQLKEKGGRVTEQRGAVAQAMRELSIPATVEEIFRVAVRHRTMDLVTTYRILDQLEKCGLVTRIFGRSGTQLFTLRTDRPRYFAIDRDTNEPIEIDSNTAAAIERSTQRIEASLAKLGYTELSSVVQFFVDRRPPLTPDAKPKLAPKPPPVRPFASLKAIVAALKADFPDSDPKSVVHHPAFIELEKRARRGRKNV